MHDAGASGPPPAAAGHAAGQPKQKHTATPTTGSNSRSWLPAALLLTSLVGMLLMASKLGKLPTQLLGFTARLKAAQGKVFTPEQLSYYDGEKSKPYYLGILGEVYDVSAGTRFYAKGEGYHQFIGRDASRSFVTGDFVGDLTDNVTDFDEQQCSGLMHWRGFFRNHTVYAYKGRLVGAFYDAAGNPTDELARVEKLAALAKSAEQLMREAEAKHPNCNSRWNAVAGGYVWCDDGMYPRKITSQFPGASKPTVRCACFKDVGWSDVRQVYPGCKPQDTECQVTPPGPAPDPFSKKKKKGVEPAASAEAGAAANEAAAEAKQQKEDL